MSISNSSLLIGPFSQILTLRNLSLYGSLRDDDLDVIQEGGLIVQEGRIKEVGFYNDLYQKLKKNGDPFHIHELSSPCVCTPGLVDAHTHLCYAGSRARDFTDRLNGISYLEISRRGGGIKETMRKTRQASEDSLIQENLARLHRHLHQGITTVEIKSGYGLSVEAELKQLRAIQKLNTLTPQTLIPTCLAAHVCPSEWTSSSEYLHHLKSDLLPQVLKENLASRIDVFVEEGAFGIQEARSYLKHALQMGFEGVVHADQFERGGAQLAGELKVKSADHLEVSKEEDLLALHKGNVSALVLPGASMGLGCGFAPARKMLDLGLSVAIASDWNPGSAPMGHLLLQASVLGTFECLSSAEIWSGITFRAAHALGLSQVGRLEHGYKADYLIYEIQDYREIIYQQGMLNPREVWCGGNQVDLSS